MTDKAPPAGWVVQVTTPGQPALTSLPSGRRSSAPGAPSFKYFNAAIPAPEKAIEAAKHAAKAEHVEACVVRALSSEEIAALRLKAGEVKRA